MSATSMCKIPLRLVLEYFYDANIFTFISVNFMTSIFANT